MKITRSHRLTQSNKPQVRSIATNRGRSSDESFDLAVKEVSRVVNETREFFKVGHNSNAFDALALEDALFLEKREGGNIAHLAMLLESLRVVWATRVKGCVLVAPRGSGKSAAVSLGLKQANWDPTTEGSWTHRISFSSFMDDSVERLLMFKRDRTLILPDPLPYVVQQLVKSRSFGGDGIRLLILEDVQVSSMLQAMLLRRLFYGLFGFGVGVIMTTPRPPSTWYSYGVERQKLTPFVDLVESKCEFVRLDTRFKYEYPII